GDGAHGQALLLGLRGGLRALPQADPDLDAAVAQVQRMGVALGSEADDGDLLALDDGQVGVVVVEDLSHDVLLRCGVRATGRSYRRVSWMVSGRLSCGDGRSGARSGPLSPAGCGP